MPDESFPIEIEGVTYSLRFEDKDVEEIEKTVSLFVAFHPQYRTYDNAATLLWRGLRKVNPEGKTVYAIQQGPPGKPMAVQMVKSFCRQFSGQTGMMILYGSYNNALVLSGWYGAPDPDTKPKPATGDTPKN